MRFHITASKIICCNDQPCNTKYGENDTECFLLHNGCLLRKHKQYAAELKYSILEHSTFFRVIGIEMQSTAFFPELGTLYDQVTDSN